MKENQDYELHIGKRPEEEYRFNQEVELFYMFKGQMRVREDENQIDLDRGDVLLINPNHERSVICRDGAIVLTLRLTRLFMMKFLGNTEWQFYCSSVTDMNHSYKEIGGVLKELVYSELFHPHRTEAYRISLLYKILDLLTEEYLIREPGIVGVDDQKVNQMIEYVYANYRGHISLQNLADEMYTSKSTLSRVFRKRTGTYFADFVGQIRMNNALNQLMYTDQSITEIAMDSGFSNASALNRLFRDKYQLTPTEYREKQRVNEDRIRQHRQKEEEELRDAIRQMGLEDRVEGAVKKTVAHIDVNDSLPFTGFHIDVINMGSVFSMTSANVQKHALFLVRCLGVHYVRMWNVFSEKLLISDGTTIGSYNFNALDTAFDFLVSSNIRLYLDLGRRPNMAMHASGKKIFYEEECISFASRENWEDAVRNFFRHIVKRYGRETVETWIFEVSYDNTDKEADWHYPSTIRNYFTVYEYIFRVLKHDIPNARMGGPSAEPASYDPSELREFLNRCSLNECRPDFISCTLFPYMTGEKDKKDILKRDTDPYSEQNTVRHLKEFLAECGYGDTPLYISEMNDTLSNRDFLNDSCHRGTYFIKVIQELCPMAEKIGIWFGSDWISSYYDSKGIINGAGGLVTKDTIKKPAFFALAFLHNIEGTLIARGDNYIVTKRGNCDFAILCYNNKQVLPEYYESAAHEHKPQEIRNVFCDHDSLELEVLLEKVPEVESGTYILHKSRISRKHGSVLEEWERFGCDTELKPEDIKYIMDVTIPFEERKRIVPEQGTVQLEMELSEHEIMYLELTGAD